MKKIIAELRQNGHHDLTKELEQIHAYSDETIQKIEEANKDKTVTKLRKAITFYKKKDPGFAMVRMGMINKISDLNKEILAAMEKGKKKFDVDKAMSKKKYKMDEPYFSMVNEYIKAVVDLIF